MVFGQLEGNVEVVFGVGIWEHGGGGMGDRRGAFFVGFGGVGKGSFGGGFVSPGGHEYLSVINLRVKI